MKVRLRKAIIDCVRYDGTNSDELTEMLVKLGYQFEFEIDSEGVRIRYSTSEDPIVNLRKKDKNGNCHTEQCYKNFLYLNNGEYLMENIYQFKLFPLISLPEDKFNKLFKITKG